MQKYSFFIKPTYYDVTKHFSIVTFLSILICNYSTIDIIILKLKIIYKKKESFIWNKLNMNGDDKLCN
jgi:hypothetical protein